MSTSPSPLSFRAQTRVLLVEEDIDELASIAADLRQRGVHVALANGLSMACERAKTQRVDVVIAASELTEAREDGLSLLDALAIELGQLPPILFLVREGPGPLQGESIVRGDPDALVARVLSMAAPANARGAESAPPSGIYSGSLANVSLGDVVETLSVDAKTGTLAVTTPMGAGDIRFRDGMVVDAVFLRFEGMKALVRMLGQSDGRFLFSPETPAVLPRMALPTKELLRVATEQLTRARALRTELGDIVSKVLLATDAGDTSDLSPMARAVLARLRGPATAEEIVDELSEPDASILAAFVELESSGRMRRLAHDAQRVPLVGTEHLHLMRALVSRAQAPGYEGSTRLVFAGTPGRLAVFAHAALCIADSIASGEAPPPVPIPHSIVTIRLGDDVDVELVALPLVPAYAPLWPLALAGAAIVVRLDDAAGPALSEACAAAELAVLDAQILVGALEEASVAQVAGLVRAAIEATQGS